MKKNKWKWYIRKGLCLSGLILFFNGCSGDKIDTRDEKPTASQNVVDETKNEDGNKLENLGEDIDSGDFVENQEDNDIRNKDSEKENLEDNDNKGSSLLAIEGYEKKEYKEALNPTSDIRVEYIEFYGKGVERLNNMIFEKAKGLTILDPLLFSDNPSLTLDYNSEVTLYKNKVLSLIFYGYSNVEGSAYPTTNLYPMNINLSTFTELELEDVIDSSKEFSQMFFEKAYFPVEPITSYEEGIFKDMLQLQSEEFSGSNPFDIEGNVKFFLKERGIVFTMSAIHATGSDHFEGEISYEDLKPYYKLNKNIWE